MPIKTTSDADVRALIEALKGPDAARREAAVARLTIIGGRAVGRLIAAFEIAGRDTRLAILRVLESTGDDRALRVARQALEDGGDVAVAGVAVLNDLLRRGTGRTHTEALDILLTLSVDAKAERRVRAAAAEALGHAPPDVRDAVEGSLTHPESSEQALWEDAAEGRLPDDPGALREAIAVHAEPAPLAVLHRMIESVKDRERAAIAGPRHEAWRAVRGALHQALAVRGSRIALYDLRETMESTLVPLPSPFLAALQTIGDASCLEPIATAFARGKAHPRWRHQLSEAFHVIARRERVTKRHTSMRRALTKAPELETGAAVS